MTFSAILESWMWWADAGRMVVINSTCIALHGHAAKLWATALWTDDSLEPALWGWS